MPHAKSRVTSWGQTCEWFGSYLLKPLLIRTNQKNKFRYVHEKWKDKKGERMPLSDSLLYDLFLTANKVSTPKIAIAAIIAMAA